MKPPPRDTSRKSGDFFLQLLPSRSFVVFSKILDGWTKCDSPLDIVNNPIPSMYDIFTYIWLMFMVNVGKYSIHGCYGNIISYNNKT